MGNITGKRKREEEALALPPEEAHPAPTLDPESILRVPPVPPEEAHPAPTLDPEEDLESPEVQEDPESILRESGICEYLGSFQGGMSRDSIKTLLSRLVDAVEFSYEQVVYLITSIFQSLISLVAI
jgi:hypothetical protein